MQLNSINKINFQKKLLAKAVVGSQYNPQSVNIYHIDELGDYKELKRKLSSDEWKNSIYAKDVMYFFKKDYDIDKYITMETEDEEKIIAIADVADNFSGGCRINYLETAPKYAQYAHQDRTYKYAGETMVSYITKFAKQQNRDNVALTFRDVRPTKEFYFFQCGFDYNYPQEAVLSKEQFDDLITQNERHTGSSIDMSV